MKTVVIWNEFDGDVKYKVVDGDRRHWDKQYINSVLISSRTENEISDCFYDNKFNRVPLLDDFPVEEVKQGAAVVTCGFLP